MVSLVVGDANADVSAALERFPHEGDDSAISWLGWGSGGSAANVATALARLGGGARLLSRVGRDVMAELALRAAKKEGVDLGFVETDESLATGFCVAAISPGERTLFSFRGANVALGRPDMDAVFRGVDFVHIAGHALLEGKQRETALGIIEEAGRRAIGVSIDLCLPLVRKWPRETLELAPRLSIVLANRSELEAFFPTSAAEDRLEEALEAILSRGAKLVIGKLGARGALVAEGKNRSPIEPMVVDACDTTGAGDSFVAAFLFAFLQGARPEIAARIACAAGALAASKRGAAEATPSREELCAALETRGATAAFPFFAPRGEKT